MLPELCCTLYYTAGAFSGVCEGLHKGVVKPLLSAQKVSHSTLALFSGTLRPQFQIFVTSCTNQGPGG